VLLKKSVRAIRAHRKALKRGYIFDAFTARVELVPFPSRLEPEFSPARATAGETPVLQVFFDTP
jgi:hypothetical protein